MESEASDARAVVEAYREQFGRAHHLDYLVLFTSVFLVALLVVLLVISGLGIIEDKWSQFIVTLVAMSLAASGAHMTIANTGDYLVTFVVIGLMTRGMGLVQRGLFPVSLLAQFPEGFSSFGRRLIGGFRGPFLVIYLVLGWGSSFLALNLWLESPLALSLAVLPPLVLGVLSTLFCYNRLRYQLTALRRHEELGVASMEELVGRHCDMAEALLWLDPPRLFHAQRQYELALEIEPDNPRAKEGLQQVLAWKARARRP